MPHLQTSTAYSSVDSTSTSTNYNVFINHCPDVKNTFAGHLYYRLLSHGLQPFLNRDELQVGKLLSLQIERALRTASVHILIFSPGYADSRWCLDELLLILNKSGDTIIPVFYKVKPSELRWTGRYVQALCNHEQNGRYDRETLEKWRKALSDISYMIGLELQAYNGDEGKLLDTVVQYVLEKGGLNVPIEDFEITVSLQQRKNEKVKAPRSVAVGMGGLGKLITLAKTLFNKPSPNFGCGQVDEDTLIDQQIVMFKMKTLIDATQNFHDDNKLGEGRVGPVYKGITKDGRKVAVKKLSIYRKEEFLNEINILAKIHHRNIVNLLGYCSEGAEIMLVYEYLPNSSLDNILFDPYKRLQLDWETRYNIIVGIVRGLLYLHEDSQLRIIHGNIKPSNILLDLELNPKIVDFGLAKVLHDETHIGPGVAVIYEDETCISRVCRTSGYIAPEYVAKGHLSVKSDVYGFGVLLLELVTGRKNMDFNLSPERQMLLEWVRVSGVFPAQLIQIMLFNSSINRRLGSIRRFTAHLLRVSGAWRSYTQQNIEEMIDPSIIETCDVEEASRCIHVALLCTQDDSSVRPQMSTAIFMLSSRSAMLPEPIKPSFINSPTESTSSGLGDCNLDDFNP